MSHFRNLDVVIVPLHPEIPLDLAWQTRGEYRLRMNTIVTALADVYRYEGLRDMVAASIIHAKPELFFPEGPLWLDIRPYRASEANEEEDFDPKRQLVGFSIHDERILWALGEKLPHLFADTRGLEYAVAEFYDWLYPPLIEVEDVLPGVCVLSPDQYLTRVSLARALHRTTFVEGGFTAIIGPKSIQRFVESMDCEGMVLTEHPLSQPRYLVSEEEMRELAEIFDEAPAVDPTYF